MIGRFARRARNFPLFPAVCVAVGLVPLVYVAIQLTASGSPPAISPGSPTPPALIEQALAPARALVVTYTPGTGPPSARPQPVRPVLATVTDVARVREVAGLLDGLTQAPPGAEWSCPAFDGGTVKLAFLSRAGGRTLAVGDYQVSCPPMGLTIGGVQQASAPIVSETFTRQVLRIAGIRATTASLFGSPADVP